MSLWFSDFATWTDVMMNGILIGVVIQGVSFYGIGEAYLWMIDHDKKVPLWLAVSLLAISEIGWIFFSVKCDRRRTMPASDT